MTTASSSTTRTALMDRLVNKAGGVRSEATIQSDVRMLLLDQELGLADYDLEVHLEAQVGAGRRIDVEVGCTVIEVKKSLASPAAVKAAITQLTVYVQARTTEMGQRYVGILTDGKTWIAYHEVDGGLVEATRHVAVTGTGGATALLRWLEGVLATKRSVRPTPTEIADRLGAGSSSHALDHSTLTALYEDSRDLPTVVLKRELWANLLRSALGTQFTDDDTLFLEHTLLVNSAEIIAHLVLGLDAEELSAATLLSGDQFAIAGLHGVVDRDFFDWVLEVPGGEGFVTALARRLARFDWSAVEHDVLKVLYESVISPETRKALGEYYTPDWLAHRVVNEVVTDPLNQRVLDPSCGSGTFVFYAVRRFLKAADEGGLTLEESMSLVSSRVMGIDLHPVAVALARVTYLLALGRERLNAPDRGSLSVPIYLGDSLGWDQREDLLTVDQLIIPTEVGDQLLSGELVFGEHLLEDAARFDALVQTLVDESGRAVGKATNKLSEGTIRRLALSEADLPDLNANFRRLKELHEANRNHIWSYYIRNVARPAWLAREENRVDVLVGNPPWLSYRHMTVSMQKRFKTLAKDRDFWSSETTATHQDLAGLFVARAVERYLKVGGRLAFVVPNSVIDRDYWSGFRDGRFEGAAVTFTPSWDLRRIRPHLFPRGSAVIFGNRSPVPATMPRHALIWTGRAPQRHASTDSALLLHQTVGELSIGSEDDQKSPYATRFAQGANLVPRVFFRTEPSKASALGVPAGRAAVQSKRSVSEKKPWKELPNLQGTVETQFLWPVALGEQVVPFLLREPDRFVIPLTQKGEVLHGEHSKIDGYPGLADWVRKAEALWAQNRQSKMTLVDQIDHMSKLSQQVPISAVRVVYSKSGMHVAAAVVEDHRVVIDHKLYWATVRSLAEGHFVVGILNTPVLTDLVRPLMSYGKDERDIDKHVWKLPIPTFDPDIDLHVRIADLAADLAEEIAELEFTSSNFVTIRRELRTRLASSDKGKRLDALVTELLDVDAVKPLDKPSANQPVLIRTHDTSGMPSIADVEIDVDCEFDAQGRVYLWGAMVRRDGEGGQSPAFTHFIDKSIDPDEAALAKTFADWLCDQIDDAHTAGLNVAWFHYGHVEVTHLRRLVDADLADRLADQATDLLADVIRPAYFAPTGYGLKTLAPAAGATWHVAGATGRDTLDWVEQARAGDESMWEQIARYNREDTEATQTLRTALRGSDQVGWVLPI